MSVEISKKELNMLLAAMRLYRQYAGKRIKKGKNWESLYKAQEVLINKLNLFDSPKCVLTEEE